MKTDLKSLLLLAAGTSFFVYLLTKMFMPRFGGDERLKAAHARLDTAKRAARDRTASPEVRAAALREAAVVALHELRRPELAASYALRSERLHPPDAEAVGLLAAALRKGEKYRALERILWRHLASNDGSAPAYQRSFDELLSLYEGPLGRPEAAKVLRDLRAAGKAS